MSGPVLVTGATGFIGGYVVRRLVASGEAVRVLARRPENVAPEVRNHIEVVRGDLRDPDAIRAAVAGVDTVLHLAACARAWSRDPHAFADLNVHAVRALLDQAAASEVRRLVHVSTILTLPAHRPAPIPGRPPGPTPYEVTKREGERLVEAYAAEGRHAVIVHPTRVYGPGPLHDANSVTKAIALYLRGRLRVRLGDGDAQANYVHADDVAAGIILAGRSGLSGAHFVLGGEDASFRRLLDVVAELTGVRRRVIPLRPRVALAVATVAELWGTIRGETPITRGWVRALMEDRRADITPARQELGYDPRPLHIGLAETIAWLERDGHLPVR